MTRRYVVSLSRTAACVLGLTSVGALAQETPREWWRDAVFYEVFVRSFADSTEGKLAGDGIGDLRGLTERLDTLNDGNPETDTDLGVTALWLMPICQSPSYHGYDVVDYLQIDDEYGSRDDFRRLVAAAHERGIRVIVDLVINHTSDQHPWFRAATDPASETHGWYVWSETPKPTLWDSKVWHDDADNGLHYFGLFWRGMPDLNLQNPEATRAVHGLSQYWLLGLGADGFRLDALKHLIEQWPHVENTQESIDWLEDYHDAMKAARPDAFLVGEVWAGTDEVARYIPDGLDAGFEFSLAYAIVEGVRDGNAQRIRHAIESAQASYPPGQFATFLANHDMQRVMSTLLEASGDPATALAQARLCATIQLTLPGIPFIYYGEEIGMTGNKPDPDLRTPMQWTADADTAGFTRGTPWREPNPDTLEVNLEAQLADPDSLHATYRRLIRQRHEHAHLWQSGLTLFDAGDPDVLAYRYQDENDALIVLANCSDRTITGLPDPRRNLSDTADSGSEGFTLLPWAAMVLKGPN